MQFVGRRSAGLSDVFRWYGGGKVGVNVVRRARRQSHAYEQMPVNDVGVCELRLHMLFQRLHQP
jgi:hypothetical protein